MELLQDAEFWVAIAFVVFVVAVFRPARRVMIGGLDARSQRIRADLEEARRLREEAETLLSEYQRKQREAEREVAGIVARAREEAQRGAKEAASAIDAAFTRREKAAMEKIAQAEVEALTELRQRATDIATAAARHLLTEGLDPARARALISGAISEFEQRAH
jgi:F-type H+-transporting ATPase subunit b